MQYSTNIQKEKSVRMESDQLKFPVGRYEFTEPSEEQWEQWIATIEQLPEKLRNIVTGLSYDDLEKTYRPEGWNVKQIVHHMADSHMNSFIRFKLILTEDTPTLKPYNEKAWAETEDAKNEDVADSLDLLEGLHKRWATLLRSITAEEKLRRFVHPEYKNEYNLKWMLCLYDWHCRHHLAHIKLAVGEE